MYHSTETNKLLWEQKRRQAIKQLEDLEQGEPFILISDYKGSKANFSLQIIGASDKHYAALAINCLADYLFTGNTNTDLQDN